MNFIDLGIIVVTAFFIFESQRRGLTNELLNLFGLLFALIGSLLFYPNVASLVTTFFSLPKIAVNPISFLVCWLIFETVYSIITYHSAKKYLVKLVDKPADKYLAFIPGIINGLLFSAFVLLFLVSIPISPIFKKSIFDSKIGAPLITEATVLEQPFNSVFGPIAKQSLTFLTVNPEEKGSVNLGYQQDQQTVDYAGEKEIFNLVNQERAKIGVQPLVWDETRAQVGRAHSEDMFKRGYFSHYSPEGKDVGDRLQTVGITYEIAGENLALAPSIQSAHTGLMNSPGHKRNILDPAFNKVGIGVIDGGVYGKMVTQVFTN
jgi:uncharacterized protein YkwD